MGCQSILSIENVRLALSDASLLHPSYLRFPRAVGYKGFILSRIDVTVHPLLGGVTAHAVKTYFTSARFIIPLLYVNAQIFAIKV